jgi:hypothetical protein
MSRHALEWVAVLGRVGSGDLHLGLSSAAEMLELSYRQTKRLWRRYREAGRAAEAWQCGSALESGQARKDAAASAAVDYPKIFRWDGRALRAAAGRRAHGGRRWDRAGPRDLAALDAGAGAVEPAPDAQETLPTAGAQAAFWRTGSWIEVFMTGWRGEVRWAV